MMAAAGAGVRGYHPVNERDALEAVKLCVELGNDVNAVGALGETALHATAYRGLSGSDTIIQWLVQNGAKVNVKNLYGWTPLTIAEGIYYGGSDTRSDKMAETFRKLGAEPSAPDIARSPTMARQKMREKQTKEKEANKKQEEQTPR